jgi:murein DD-endopeptidase MepM/ murein hydrolase activator NlpD
MDAARRLARIRNTRAGALAGLALSGIFAAFATIAPQSDAERALARAPTVESIAIRPAEHVLSVPERFVREERFQAGDTVAGLLARLGVAEDDAQPLLRLKELRRLRPGSTVTAEVGPAGELARLEFLGARDLMSVIVRHENGFRASEERASLQTHFAMKSGVIRSSLFAAADAAAVPDSVAIQLADVFGGDIDFHRDLRKGDRFSVIYELQTLQGRPVRAGRVLAAEFRNQGRIHRAVWFGGADADVKKGGGYYAADGKNLRKAFLRSPLEFSRVSSGFGMRRHPFLQSWRAHSGVDYAAPAGTRVRAVGYGVVEFAGRQGGYGNVVMVRHPSNVTTLYAHLNAFGRGLRKGTRIAQGDTLGTVGQTGWATGPHLHYEFRVAGQARNPLAVALPAAQPVAAHEMGAFRVQAEPLNARLDLLGQGDLALLE